MQFKGHAVQRTKVMQFRGQRSCGSKDKGPVVQRTKVMQFKGHAVQKTKVMQFKGQRSKPEGCTNTEYSFTREKLVATDQSTKIYM